MNILIIANYFPPVNSSGSIQTFYYVKHLAELGHKIDLITMNYPDDYLNYDNELNKAVSMKNVNLHKVDMGKVYSKIYPKKSLKLSSTSPQNKSFVSRMKKIVKSNFAIPDSYLEWRLKAVKKGKEILRNKNIDIIFSLIESPSSHLVAMKLKKSNKDLKWIGFWSDPWTLSIDFNKKSLLRQVIERNMEKKVLRNIDKCLFMTQTTKEKYVKEFGLDSDVCSIVSRGFDINKYNEVCWKTDTFLDNDLFCDKKINILHAGELYSQYRDISPFLNALKKMKIEKQELFNKISLIILGGVHGYSNKEYELIEELKVKTLPRVSFEKSIAYMNKSDLLLIFGNIGGIQIPGKIYDYFGISKPIFTILADRRDPLKNIVKNANRGPFVINQQEDIYQMLLSLEGQKLEGIAETPYYKYEWKNVIKRLEYELIN